MPNKTIISDHEVLTSFLGYSKEEADILMEKVKEARLDKLKQEVKTKDLKKDGNES
jgi:hypothetical protein